MGLPIWYFTLLVYFIGSTTNSLLQRKLAVNSKLPPKLVTAILYSCFLMPLGFVIAGTQRNFWINWQPITVLLLLLQAVCIAGFFARAFQLNRVLDATQYVVIMNMYTIVTVLIGIFILHEDFTGSQFIGTLLLILGGILVVIKGFTKEAMRFDRHTLEMFALSMALGVGLAAERGALNYMSYSVYAVLGWGLQTLFLCVVARKDWKKLSKITKKEWKDIAKLGTARAFHNSGFFLSVALSKNIALIASVSSFRIPLVFIASFLFLNERDHLLRRFAGVTIATIGLILI